MICRRGYNIPLENVIPIATDRNTLKNMQRQSFGTERPTLRSFLASPCLCLLLSHVVQPSFLAIPVSPAGYHYQRNSCRYAGF